MIDESWSSQRFLRHLDWNLLGSFVILAEAKSISDGAERLGMRQPSASNALKRLEEVIGRQLIDRRPGRYRLTAAGELLYREAVEIQGSVQRLETLLRSVGETVEGEVAIAMASHVVCPLLDGVIGDFHRRYPQATLSVEISSSRDAVAKVLAKRATLAIGLVGESDPRLTYTPLYREYFGLFCGPEHPLYGRENLSEADLAGHSSVSFTTDQLNDVLRPVSLLRARLQLDQRIVATSAHLEEVRRMILAGLGIGALPVHVVERDVSDGLLWPLPPRKHLPAIDVQVIAHPGTVFNRAEQHFSDLLLQRIDETPKAERDYLPAANR